jgi:3-hydroxyisobutyrate dehydrogenase
MRVGFVGLGVMGLPMARHLVEAGHDVTVASRSRPPVDAAVALGAVDGGDPAGVAGASDVVVICVPDTPDVLDVIAAMRPALRSGHVIVDCSTIDPDVSRQVSADLATLGVAYLDTPVSGGSVGAERGTLTLMVGGDAGALERARPALEAFSSLIVHCGDSGQGSVVKLCNNLIYAAQMQATSEAFSLGAKSGGDLRKAHEVITHGTGDCTAVRSRVPFEGVLPDSPASNGWKPGFMTDLMAKDLDIALAYAARLGVRLASTETARDTLARAQAAGYGREDCSAVGKVIRAESGV